MTKDKDLNIYVSIRNGNDANCGTKLEPFQSIERGQTEVRSRLRESLMGNVTVWIGGGQYFLTNPLSFDEQDSGSAGYTVTYQNVPNEQPVIVGGQVCTGWERQDDHIYRTQIGIGKSLHTLFENGVRSVQARSPKMGYHVVTGKGTGKMGIDFSFAREDLPYISNPQHTEVYIWPGEGEWNWFTETKSVESIDYDQTIISLNEPAPWGIDCGSRYRLQGAIELLTEPGEYHWDETHGFLYYYPRQLPIDKQQIIAPVVRRIIELKGSQPQKPVQNLVFEGLTLEISNFTREYRMPIDNCERQEAREGLIYIENAEHNTIRNCTLRHAGYNSIMLNGHCMHNRIVGNIIEHSGYNGIYLIGWAPGEGNYKNAEESYVNKFNLICNNLIRFGGELVGHGSGIQLYQSGDNEITHNQIYHMPRYGISLKGLRRQGMAPIYYGTEVTWENHWDFLHARNNRITCNDISDVMKDSQDGGMFESWGAGKGNHIMNNRFHHSGIYFSFGFCIYLDDASDEFLISHNIIHDLYSADSGVLWFIIFSKGIGNQIINNLLINNDARAAIGTQEMVGEANRDITVLRNIMYNSGEQLYHFVNWDDERFKKADYNLFYNRGKEVTVTGINGDDKRGRFPIAWKEWRKRLGGKFDKHTLIQDPLIETTSNEFRLHAESSAYKLGWEPLDVKSIGLLTPESRS